MTEAARNAAERARVLVGTGRHDAALATVATALAQVPGDVDLLAMQASALCHLERWDDALASTAAGLATDPADAHLLLLRSHILDERGDRIGAHDAALEVTRLYPQLADGHRRLALVLMQDIGTQEMARAAAWRAVELAPHDPESHVAMAATLWPPGTAVEPSMREAARSHIAEALRLEPGHARAASVLAWFDVREGKLGRSAGRIARQAGLDGGRSAGDMAMPLWWVGVWFSCAVIVQAVVVAATSWAPWIGRIVAILPLILLARMLTTWARAVPTGRRGYLRRFAQEHRVATAWFALMGLVCVGAVVVAWTRW